MTVWVLLSQYFFPPFPFVDCLLSPMNQFYAAQLWVPFSLFFSSSILKPNFSIIFFSVSLYLYTPVPYWSHISSLIPVNFCTIIPGMSGISVQPSELEKKATTTKNCLMILEYLSISHTLTVYVKLLMVWRWRTAQCHVRTVHWIIKKAITTINTATTAIITSLSKVFYHHPHHQRRCTLTQSQLFFTFLK